MSTEKMCIDAVIMWVDGDDPAHRAKRMSYMNGGREAKFDDVAGETRYRQVGEINFCVASVLRFAPFVRKIFIVTDNQNPNLDEFIALNFPDNRIPIEIVDHKVIFRGYEQYLPTFNSLSITTMLWRIPGLAEHFLLLNDDLMMFAPVKPSDFFTPEGGVVAYANWRSAFIARLKRSLRLRRSGHRRLAFRDVMLNAADLLGVDRFLRIKHTPHTLRRSFFEEFFAEHPGVLENQIQHRFRHDTQFSALALQYTALAHKGPEYCRVETSSRKYLYMKPRNGRVPSDGRLAKLEKRKDALFLCMNSLDIAAPDEAERLIAWLSRLLDVKIPQTAEKP